MRAVEACVASLLLQFEFFLGLFLPSLLPRCSPGEPKTIGELLCNQYHQLREMYFQNKDIEGCASFLAKQGIFWMTGYVIEKLVHVENKLFREELQQALASDSDSTIAKSLDRIHSHNLSPLHLKIFQIAEDHIIQYPVHPWYDRSNRSVILPARLGNDKTLGTSVCYKLGSFVGGFAQFNFVQPRNGQDASDLQVIPVDRFSSLQSMTKWLFVGSSALKFFLLNHSKEGNGTMLALSCVDIGSSSLAEGFQIHPFLKPNNEVALEGKAKTYFFDVCSIHSNLVALSYIVKSEIKFARVRVENAGLIIESQHKLISLEANPGKFHPGTTLRTSFISSTKTLIVISRFPKFGNGRLMTKSEIAESPTINFTAFRLKNISTEEPQLISSLKLSDLSCPVLPLVDKQNLGPCFIKAKGFLFIMFTVSDSKCLLYTFHNDKFHPVGARPSHKHLPNPDQPAGIHSTTGMTSNTKDSSTAVAGTTTNTGNKNKPVTRITGLKESGVETREPTQYVTDDFVTGLGEPAVLPVRRLKLVFV